MINFSNKSFELIDETQEENHTDDPSMKKRFQPRLVYNKAIYDQFERISRNVDNRIKYLLNVCKDIKDVVTACRTDALWIKSDDFVLKS